MKSWRLAITLAAISLLLAFALAAAQEPVRSFDQLNTRLKPGDTIWVTDAQGREIEGSIESIGPDALTLEAGAPRAFAPPDVTATRAPRHSATAIGALSGLAAGTACGIGFLVKYPGTTAEEPGMAAIVVLGLAGLGAGAGAIVGWVIDAARDSKKEVYRAPGSSQARLSIAPLVTPRAKGAALSFAF
jgi:hypothetical protein